MGRSCRASVVPCDIHLVDDLAVSANQQPLERLLEAWDSEARGCIAEEDPVPAVTHIDTDAALVVHD